MPQRERMRVWRGELRKTAGGLTKNDLVRNARGKIVSRKKSKGATNENNLGKWLRTAGDSFGGKLQDAGLPLPKSKGKKHPKAPKPQTDRKIKKPAAPKPKPNIAKPKPAAPKPKPKPKPKANPPKPKPKPKANPPPPRRRKSPVKAGQLKDYSKISVGNILKSQPVTKKGWPSWAKKLTYHKYIKAIQEMIGNDFDWDDAKMEMEERFDI